MSEQSERERIIRALSDMAGPQCVEFAASTSTELLRRQLDDYRAQLARFKDAGFEDMQGAA